MSRQNITAWHVIRFDTIISCSMPVPQQKFTECFEITHKHEIYENHNNISCLSSVPACQIGPN